MESKVIFRDGMDNDPADYNNLQGFVERSLDHIVFDGISPDRKFAGFMTAISAAAEITIAAGRLFNEGKVYLRADALVKSFLTSLPVATKKVVMVVAYGQTIDTDERPREYLLNEDTGASQPQTYPLERARICTIGFAAGQEGPDPLDPVIDAGVLPIARVVLNPAGVVSVDMIVENKLPSATALGTRVESLEDFRRKTAPQIATIGSDLAALKETSSGLVDRATYARALGRLATIEAKTGIPSTAADSSCDFFLDKSGTDVAFAGFDAKVEEGIRFPAAATVDSTITMLNPMDPNATVSGALLFPAFTHERRLTVGPRQGEVPLTSSSSQTHEMVQKTMSSTRLRYSGEFTACSNAAWWQSGKYNATAGIFDDGTFSYEVLEETPLADGHASIFRLRYVWYDTVDEPYWEQVTIDHSVLGCQVAETFLNANAGWLTKVGLTFTKLANAGTVTVIVCETFRGAPDLDKVVSFTTVNRADLKLNEETLIPITPTWLEGGKRYAVSIISAADHWLATTQGINYGEGTMFSVLDGAYQQGDGTRDLCLSLHFAKFSASRAIIPLQSLQLAGGIASIDILANSIVPASCDLTYEVQINGVWFPLAPGDSSVLAQGGVLQALLPFRAVFTGTPDAMPVIKTTGSRVRASRAKTTLKHISKIRTLPAPSTQIRTVARLEYFDAAHNTATGKILTGAGYATVVTASSVVDRVTEDGALERTCLFNLGAAVSSYRRQYEATTDSNLRTFHFAKVADYAL